MVNAKIKIEPDATNEVGKPHTFTATLEKDVGDGKGFVAAAGESMTITLSNSNGAVANPAGPFNCTTNANGQCTATFTSATPGQVTGNASSTLSVGGVPFTVSTNGTARNSGPATKTFVDAYISITPNGTNAVGQTHTFTGHVNVSEGSGSPFVNAPEGTTINFAFVGSHVGALSASSCTTVGTTGSCTIDRYVDDGGSG